MEHAIAALLGVSASTFSIKPEIVAIKLPQIPTGVPAALLRAPAGYRGRAAAHDCGQCQHRGRARGVFSRAHARRSRRLPEQRLLELAERAERVLGDRTQRPLSVFDGGLRRAQVAQARAEFDASAANYRGTVVSAFQQVEDSLATLNHYHDAALDEKAAVDAAQRTLDFSMALYKQGATDYLTVVTSQTALLQTQLEALNLDTLQLTASVDLIRALGGGWVDSTSAQYGKAMPKTPYCTSSLCSG